MSSEGLHLEELQTACTYASVRAVLVCACAWRVYVIELPVVIWNQHVRMRVLVCVRVHGVDVIELPVVIWNQLCFVSISLK